MPTHKGSDYKLSAVKYYLSYSKYPDLKLSRVHLGRVVRDINITLKQTRLRHVPKTRYKNLL